MSADSTSNQTVPEYILNRPISPDTLHSFDPPHPIWQRGISEDSSILDDGPIAHRLRSKRCKCPKIKRDCITLIDDLEVLRRKIASKDCLAVGAMRYHLKTAHSMMRQINEFLHTGEIRSFEDTLAWHSLWTERACYARSHKWWTLKKKKEKKT